MIEIDPRTAAGVAGRAKVDALLQDDVRAALAEARANPHPWYRCQSLTSAAAAMDNEAAATAVLHEALAAAKQQEEPNRIVTVSAWPLSLLVGRNLDDMAPVVAELLAIIAPEPNPIRRAHALLMLLESVIRDPRLRDTVLPPLLDACAESRGWKGRRILQFAALALAGVHKLAQHVASLIPESRESRRTQKMLARREWIGPHEFVPYYQKT